MVAPCVRLMCMSESDQRPECQFAFEIRKSQHQQIQCSAKLLTTIDASNGNLPSQLYVNEGSLHDHLDVSDGNLPKYLTKMTVVSVPDGNLPDYFTARRYCNNCTRWH